ncbi:MAG: cofactor-independent phosphoglycerate mutase [Clostridiales bacterium]|nr:cofactor-independent phosphoglycerate mutase [Clostridiales bacterium]
MKYIVIIGDGMADYPLKELGNKTPLEYADTPFMDYIAQRGQLGLVQTVPEGMVPESDTANLAILGYDPKIYSKGRSPLEALGMGVELKPNQTAIRANLVSLSDNGESYEQKTMLDHSSDEISDGEAKILIESCDKFLCKQGQKLFPGVSYRNLLVYDDAPEFTDYTRPHDILGRIIGPYLPESENSRPFLDIMKASFDLLNNHPVNIKRAEKGLKKANSLWFWAPGKKPVLPSFKEKTRLEGAVIGAVDLIRGIGRCAGLDTPKVKGATGGCVTDYSAKAKAATDELEKGKDFVYIHVEAPDECGHKGDINAKITAIENIDEKILGYIMRVLKSKGKEYKLLLLPDHPTPISIRSHTREPVPFVVYSSEHEKANPDLNYTEKAADRTSLFIDKGYELMDYFLKKED